MSAVTVATGGIDQTVTAVTDTSISVTLGDGVSTEYSSGEIVVNVKGLFFKLFHAISYKKLFT